MEARIPTSDIVSFGRYILVEGFGLGPLVERFDQAVGKNAVDLMIRVIFLCLGLAAFQFVVNIIIWTHSLYLSLKSIEVIAPYSDFITLGDMLIVYFVLSYFTSRLTSNWMIRRTKESLCGSLQGD